MKKLLLVSAGLMLAGASMAQDEIIREQPEGTLRTFHGFSLATTVSWGFAEEGPKDGLARQVVFAENGDVYFKNPITGIATHSWIKGTMKDNVITVSLPQVIDVMVDEETGEEDKWYVQRFEGATVVDEETGREDIEWTVNPDNTDIKFIFRNDSIIQDSEGKLEKLGLMNGGAHMYYGDREIVYTAVNEKSAKMPEGVATERWSLKYGDGFATQVNIAFDGDDMYIQGFWSKFPQAVMKGSIKGNKAIIDSCQYLGFLQSDEDYGYYTYLMNSTVIQYMVDYYITSVDPIEFNFDAENKVMTAIDDKSSLIVRSGKTGGVEDYSYSIHFALRNPYFAKIDKIGKPVTPEISVVTRSFDYGWGKIEPIILAEDIYGNALDVNQLTYCVWLDDEKEVFDPEFDFNGQLKYKYLDAPTTDIPYTFDNDSGISTNGGIMNKYLMYFNLGFDEIGIQSNYYDDLTETMLHSDVIYINPETRETRIVDGETVGVGAVAAGNAEIASIAFYDLNGRRMIDAPAKGLYVKVITYTDGTSKTFKKIAR